MQALRSATAELHARLDASLPLAQPHASLADYAAHAQALAAWLGALQPQLALLANDAPPGFFCTPCAARLAALQADLAKLGHLGYGAPAPSASARDQVARLLAGTPAAQAQAARWGLAYVVEGAQLGGQVLHRRLAPRLAPHPLRYLQGAGADTGARWKAFVALLRQQVATPAAVQACCQGAVAGFESLAQPVPAEVAAC